MKRIVLLITLVFSMSLSAASNWGQENMNTSMCNVWGYSWTHPTAPQANTCFDIRNVGTDLNGWDNGSHGSAVHTSKNLEGSFMRIAVDVFGVPANEPTVMYKYQTLNAVGYTQLINYNSSPDIINGTRYYFDYYGDVGSGEIIVKHYATIKDSLDVQ